jgi:transposase
MERNIYSEEFKKQMVRNILEQNKSMPQISEEVGVLHSWKAQYRDELQMEMLATQEKVWQLEQQLRETQRENQEKERQNQDLQEELAIGVSRNNK